VISEELNMMCNVVHTSLHDPVRKCRSSKIITSGAEKMLLINNKILSHTRITTACDMEEMLKINIRRRIHVRITIAYRMDEVSLTNSMERCHNYVNFASDIIIYLNCKWVFTGWQCTIIRHKTQK
jgi:hypothetical protein